MEREADVGDLRGQRLRAIERSHELFPELVSRGSDDIYRHIPHEREWCLFPLRNAPTLLEQDRSSTVER